jgi:spermidine/putrescine-binding protein
LALARRAPGWKKAVIGPFQAANPNIKVRIATGLTMEAGAMMRARKIDPKIGVAMMDEVPAAQANGEGLYEPLTTDAIPCMAKLHAQFRIAGDPYTRSVYVVQVVPYDSGLLIGRPQVPSGGVRRSGVDGGATRLPFFVAT